MVRGDTNHGVGIINCGKAAMETACARPWEMYGNELAQAILNDDNG